MLSQDTVTQLVHQVERQHPASVAVEDLDGGKVTVDDLRQRSNRLANAMLGQGLRPGERVAYISNNCREYFELDFALAKAGLVKVPLYSRLSASDLLKCLRLADVRLVVAEAGVAAELEDAWAGEGGDRPVRVVLGERAGWLGYEQLLRQGSPADPNVLVGPDDIYHVRFSSGSTGRPKGIAISHRAARSAMLGNLWVMAAQSPCRVPRTLQQAPLVFAGGWSVMPTLLMGGTNVVVGRFDAELMLRLLVEQRIDWTFAVPTMLRRLAEVDGVSALRDSSLSCLMIAGEPASAAALATLTQYTDALVNCWGQTEAPASTTYLNREELRQPELYRSIGRPIPGVEFAISRDGSIGESVVPGEVGEMVLRGPNIASYLLGAEDEYNERLLPDGWWRTGDLGRFDDDGRLFIEGRLSDVIITGGTNVHPAEIESVLEGHPAVHEALVVGVPDPDWGESCGALLSAPALAGEQLDTFDEWMRQHMSRFKRPRHVFVTPDPLPRQGADTKPTRSVIKKQVADWVRTGDLPAGTFRMEGRADV